MLVITKRVAPDVSDGFGAQFQRYIAIYCICKKLQIPYYHTPIEDINYQGVKALEVNKNSKDYVQRCNDVINLKSDIDIKDLNDFKIIDCEPSELSEQYITRLKDQCKESNTNILLRIENPYGITDNEPNIYKYAKNIYKPKIKKNEKFTIGIHVRRGELYVVDSERMLPNKWYIDIAQKIAKICKNLNINYLFELYTEMPSKKLIVTGEHPGIRNRISENKIIDPKDNKIEEFDNIPNITKYINEDTLDTFDRMVNSDILILSRSSFSACASYLKNGISIYHKFWHNMIDTDIEYSDVNFIERITLFIKNWISKNNN